jgi:SAM-dependent methyltransferase
MAGLDAGRTRPIGRGSCEAAGEVARAVTMTTEEAVLELRRDPQFGDLVRDAYLGPDVLENAERFLASGEFAALRRILGERLPGASVLDVGAGTGIASYAFARSGAREVVALEPDPSEVVGQGAIRRLADGLPIAVAGGFGEALPFPDARFDLVYLRQVLHHARDLDGLVRECARVARPGGLVVATREHVVSGAAQLEAFLAAHPVHRLAGGEHAYTLREYVTAFRKAALAGPEVLGPLDTVLNAYPAIRDGEALRSYPRALLRARLGVVGRLAGLVPGIPWMVRREVARRIPGRLYSFIGPKP